MTIAVRLLADLPQLIEPVARMRWLEWHEHGHLDHWIDTTGREAGRDELPVTWVATDQAAGAVGAVALGPHHMDGRPELTPWVWGLVVRADMRNRGVGRLLLSRLERFAVTRGFSEIWVATGPPAHTFYERCGWRATERIGTTNVLRKPI